MLSVTQEESIRQFPDRGAGRAGEFCRLFKVGKATALLDLKVYLLGPNTKCGLGLREQLISDLVSETSLFALYNCLFSYSYRLSDTTCK